jgi:hypothetical protein
MILVLLGTIIGSLFGFKAQESSQNGKFPYTKYPK